MRECLIEDAEGVPQRYLVHWFRTDMNGPGRNTAHLQPVESDLVYVVWTGPDACSCADFRFRKPEDGCKHIRWLKEASKEKPMPETATVETKPANLPAPSNGHVPTPTLQETMTLGGILAKSGFFNDARSAAQAVVKILAGRELGFAPMASMTSVHIVEGKPTIGSHLMAAKIKGSGKYDYRIKENSHTACEIEFLESGRPAGPSIRYTLDQAKQDGLITSGAGKTKANWKNHPDDMLFSRVISKGYRRYCPDLSMGVTVYCEGELEEAMDNPEPPASPVPIQALPSAALPERPERTVTIKDETLAVLEGSIREHQVPAFDLLSFLGVKALKQLPEDMADFVYLVCEKWHSLDRIKFMKHYQVLIARSLTPQQRQEAMVMLQAKPTVKPPAQGVV